MFCFSDLFGNEDQDYRHPDIISPRGQGGWAQYKADHPNDFENRRASLEDIDHRRDQINQSDTDYRSASYNRPVGPRPGYTEPPRVSSQSDNDIPHELRLENREQILRKMEMRRKSGEITHEALQQVLRNLSEFDSLQEQKRHSVAKPEPPRLEPEINQIAGSYPPSRTNEPLLEYNSPGKNQRPPIKRPYDHHDHLRGPPVEDNRRHIRKGDFETRPSLLGPGPGLRESNIAERET